MLRTSSSHLLLVFQALHQRFSTKFGLFRPYCPLDRVSFYGCHINIRLHRLPLTPLPLSHAIARQVGEIKTPSRIAFDR